MRSPRWCSLGRSRSRLRPFAWVAVCAPLLLLLASPLGAAPVVWALPSLERVAPDAPPGATTQLELHAAKGEYESFQIIVRAPEGDLTNVTVAAPDLGGPRLTLYREHYVFLQKGSPDWSTNHNKPLGPGWYPDGLIPFVDPTTGQDLVGATLDAVPFSLAAGQNQPIWVDVWVPRDQAAGTYTGTFTVISDQGSASVDLSLHVWNFALPLQPALKSCLLYWTVRGELQPDQELMRHRLMPIRTTATNERLLIDSLGMNTTNLGFWARADRTKGTMLPPPSVDEILQAIAQHQPDLYLYNYTADEITGATALYDPVKAWARNLHAAGIDQLITMAPDPALYDDGSGTGRSAVDIWTMLPKSYDAAGDRIAFVLQKGDRIWSYAALEQDSYSPRWLLDFAPINYRIQPGFISQSLSFTGVLYWRADYWTSDPWNNPTAYAGYPGEGLLVYPGAPVGLSGTVLASMRMKYLRDGVDDYDYVQLLKQAGLGDWALTISRRVGPDWTNWTRDSNALEAARLELGEKLDGLATSTPHTVTVSASADPVTIASGGTTTVSASATDSLGHSITSWVWSDGGAGGSFSPSAEIQNPIYTAAPNTSGADSTVALTVTATCSGPPATTESAATTIIVQRAHAISVTAAPQPATVASGGSCALTASATDSLGHDIASWAWSDGGAGGAFSPSAGVQNPTYTAAANDSGGDRVVTLSATATCGDAASATGSASAALTVQTVPSAHTLSVTAALDPPTVASGGTAALAASATDSLGHAIASWAWSDGGAGGVFSPSANVQNPSYTAAPNMSGTSTTAALQVTATCGGGTPATGTATATLTVMPVHAVSVSAFASPAAVASGGITSLTATATDSLGHGIASWSWSDGGAGGTFSPSPSTQNPAYAAPANTTGADASITLTVTATCGDTASASGSASTSLTVHAAPPPHTVSVTASANPNAVASGGTTSLTASATDSLGHSIASWAWSDGGAGGAFSPSAGAQSPTYTAAPNTTGADRVLTLSVTATCGGATPTSSSALATLTVQPAPPPPPHTLSVTAAANPATVASAGSTALTASATDSLGHSIASWVWSDGGAGGSFSPSASVQNPSYIAPANTGSTNKLVTLQVTATCSGPVPATAMASVALTVTPAHALTVTASVKPSSVASGGSARLSATYTDNLKHGIASWSWSDNGAGGSFSSPTVSNPTYRAAANSTHANRTVILTVTAICSGPSPATATAQTALTVRPK